MKELKTEVIIDAPRVIVWQVLTRFSAYAAWNPFVVAIQGEPVQGATLKTTMVQKGKKHHFAPTITHLKAEEQLEWLGKLPLGLFNGNHYFHLEALSASQTRLLHGERFSGLLSKIILSKIGDDTLQGFIQMNQALKMRAEALATA
ncbi:MAG: SRPBCC domain-containing protein [Bacteroidetes bacterium]|nr:SRPBCC domain-containing protein [Bacteroidota bacterium]